MRDDGQVEPPGAQVAYVVNSTSNTVTPVNVATGVTGAPIATGTGPSGIAVSPDGTKVCVEAYTL